MSTINRSSLERKTRGYWCDYDHGNPEPYLERYIKELLPEEMEYARQREESKLPDQTCDTLVLLVGFSIEPLLQAIHAYKPQKVFLVLNQRYGREKSGESWGKMVAKLIGKLPDPPGTVEQEVIEAGPQQVFQTLLEQVRQVEGTIIDITGAKKNMVAGAFLYAALANVPVSYVDFADDAYDPKEGKPYGYLCDIGTLDNPYEKFALRDWGRVRDLYTDYKFREARTVLKAMWPQVQGYFPAEANASVETMLNVLRCYEAWDAGDYNRAYDEAQKIPAFTPPDAVEMWGENSEWVKTRGIEFIPAPRFYEDMECFRAYICDELARIERLIKRNEDYLSAFVRAGGLNEVVMVSRLVRRVSNANDKNALLATLEQATPRVRNLFLALLNLDKNLNPKKRSEINFKKFYFPGAQNPPRFTIQNTTPMTSWWTETSTMFNAKNGWETFLYRRNDLTHQYYSPPLEWAEDALAFVKANVEDFWGTGAGKDVETQAQPWSEVCELTGLNEYLPPNLLGDVSD